MCRYSQRLYLPKMVCFGCRKSFKEISVCPQCGQDLRDLGRDFKPPRQANKRAWKVAQTLFENGVRFDSCGCSGPGYRPAELREIASFLQEAPQSYGHGTPIANAGARVNGKIQPRLRTKTYLSQRAARSLRAHQAWQRQARREARVEPEAS